MAKIRENTYRFANAQAGKPVKQGKLEIYFGKVEFEEVNTLDIEKIKSYYNQIRNEDLCDCDYCRNNIHEVQAAYPTSFIDIP